MSATQHTPSNEAPMDRSKLNREALCIIDDCVGTPTGVVKAISSGLMAQVKCEHGTTWLVPVDGAGK